MLTSSTTDIMVVGLGSLGFEEVLAAEREGFDGVSGI